MNLSRSAIQAIPEKLYERLDSYFRREGTSPWTFPRRKQRESEAPPRQRRKYESYARSSIYIYIYIYIFHNSREPREFGEKEIVTSIVFKWPVKSRSLVGLMLPFFHSTRRSGISPLSTLFFERARSRQSLATDQETFEAATIQPRYSNDLKDVLSPTLSSFHPLSPAFFVPFLPTFFLVSALSPHFFFFFSLLLFSRRSQHWMDFKSHFIGNLRPDSG